MCIWVWFSLNENIDFWSHNTSQFILNMSNAPLNLLPNDKCSLSSLKLSAERTHWNIMYKKPVIFSSFCSISDLPFYSYFKKKKKIISLSNRLQYIDFKRSNIQWVWFELRKHYNAFNMLYTNLFTKKKPQTLSHRWMINKSYTTPALIK